MNDRSTTTLKALPGPGLLAMSSVRPLLLVSLLLVSATIAGCIGGDDDAETGADDAGADAATVPDQWWVNAVPSSLTDENHDHSNRSHHMGITTPSFEVLGWDPMVTDFHNRTMTSMGCGGAVDRADGRRLAVVNALGTDMSFVVADITDPYAPEFMGEFYMPNAVVWDADISADGRHVVVGAYPGAVFGSTVPTLPPVPGLAATDGEGLQVYFRDACGNVSEVGPLNYVPYGPGIVLIGIQDPENPTFEDWVPQPAIGPHSVGSQLIDGVLYATASVTNLVHEGSYYTIFEIVEEGGVGKLVPRHVIRTPGIATPALNGHVDVFLHKHPHTDQVLAYLANWDGMYVYDISTPGAAIEVGVWKDGDAGSVHTTYPFPFLVDDKQYLLVAQEVGEPVDLPTGWTYILDVTDPATPTEVGRWTLPVKPKWDNGGLQFSPHYVSVLNETMFVSNYHGGLWAVDISDMTKPQASGIFVPGFESPSPWNGDGHGPSVGDVIVDYDTGILTTWDSAGGVYQLTFDQDMPTVLAPVWGEEGDAHAGH